MQAIMRDNPDEALTERLTESLMQRAEMPPERIDGVPDEFIDGMEAPMFNARTLKYR